VKEKQLTVDRLQRAEELSNGLADEQIRWKETVERLDEDLKLVLGNVFVAASSVAYYGPFTGLYRDELVDLWLAKCEELEIRVAEKYSLASVLADAVTVRNWNAKGLPSDSVSVNNGVLVYTTESFPLVIDP
jgi:dynein heavy chain